MHDSDLFIELHTVYTIIYIWSTDMDGKSIYLCVWLF